jgi:hypothetical protein
VPWFPRTSARVREVKQRLASAFDPRVDEEGGLCREVAVWGVKKRRIEVDQRWTKPPRLHIHEPNSGGQSARNTRLPSIVDASAARHRGMLKRASPWADKLRSVKCRERDEKGVLSATRLLKMTANHQSGTSSCLALAIGDALKFSLAVADGQTADLRRTGGEACSLPADPR